ncbi:MAG: GtrA family protein [Candidatus Uhrbacteria bacterium]
MIHRVSRFAKAEGGTFARFLVVGGLSFLINIGVYALLSRVLFPNGNRLIESVAANGIAILFNFLLHKIWTFGGAVKKDHFQMVRYGIVVAGAAALQACIFAFGHGRFGINDFLVIAVATGICAIFTFFAHRFFTFKRLQDVV